MDDKTRTCRCGALYGRRLVLSEAPEMGTFACIVCGEVIESFNTLFVPKYRLLVGPVRAHQP
ncbi:hypothetical protein [Bradyrhizobium sp. Leo121]|uniref:hypothetical protein n=1 Tax=Bradyrhizobium sp. Leo121 TaxID=1571195 RepID=UPI00102A5C89|nr:hypothetical protein [Bradyrhizobium sp. Leo121]